MFEDSEYQELNRQEDSNNARHFYLHIEFKVAQLYEEKLSSS